MNRIERTQLFIVLFFLLIVTSSPYLLNVVAQEISYGDAPRDANYSIVNGTATYHTDYLWAETVDDTEIHFEYELDNEITQTVINNETIKFEKEYSYTPGTIFQKYLGTFFYPIETKLEFWDYDGYYIATNPDLDFSVTTEVNCEDGEITYYDAPYDAYVSMLSSIFFDPYYYYYYYYYYYIYYGLRTWIILGGETFNTEMFEPDAPNWEIFDTPYPDYTVSSFGIYQGYSTVILRRDDPGDYDNFDVYFEYERFYGMLVREYSELEQGDYYGKRVKAIDNIGKFIDDGEPVVEGPTLVEVKNTKPITLSYIGNDVNYDHYNFYMDGVLIETDTAWKEHFNFTISPIKGNTTYTFEICDSVGNSNSLDTVVQYIGRIPGFTVAIAMFALYAAIMIKRKNSKKKI